MTLVRQNIDGRGATSMDGRGATNMDGRGEIARRRPQRHDCASSIAQTGRGAYVLILCPRGSYLAGVGKV
jgi:hypothetical protein